MTSQRKTYDTKRTVSNTVIFRSHIFSICSSPNSQLQCICTRRCTFVSSACLFPQHLSCRKCHRLRSLEVLHVKLRFIKEIIEELSSSHLPIIVATNRQCNHCQNTFAEDMSDRTILYVESRKYVAESFFSEFQLENK